MKIIIILFFLATVFSCKQSTQVNDPLIARGRSVYMSNCIACHNPDPSKPGSIGPEVAGSSLELVNSRIMFRTYPVGYKPKRKTALMPDLSQLKNDVPAIAKYLQSVKF